MTAPTEPTVRRHVWVRGQVQGVWYRQSCAEVATALGLAGWVRNRPDGRVEAVVEGPAAVVAELVAWMRVGPPRAHVVAVDVVDEPPSGASGFHVR